MDKQTLAIASLAGIILSWGILERGPIEFFTRAIIMAVIYLVAVIIYRKWKG